MHGCGVINEESRHKEHTGPSASPSSSPSPHLASPFSSSNSSLIPTQGYPEAQWRVYATGGDPKFPDYLMIREYY